MIVLGLNAFGHDAAAVLLVDGRVVFASSEERYDRRRHSAAFPERAVRAALAHVDAKEVDAVAFPWAAGMARARKAWHVLKGFPRTLAFLRESPEGELPGRVAYLASMRRLPARLRDVGLDAPLIRVPHHRAHAASARLALPGTQGAVLTADGMGEWDTAVAWNARNGVHRVAAASYPHSLGKAYAAVTQWLGFYPESDEGKTMGLAPYGDPDAAGARFGAALVLRDEAHLFRVAVDRFGFPWGHRRLYGDAFLAALGPARLRDEPVREGDADVARGIQDGIEDVVLDAARRLVAHTGAQRLAMAGGLFLNCALNGALLRALEVPVHPFPVAGDAGAAWGAAALVHEERGGGPADPLTSLFLGHDLDDEEAASVLDAPPRTPGDLADEVAQRVAAGKIVGVARGRAEFGPRALGTRSLLASPRSLEIRDRVNELKGRESWRPLAPVVLEDDTSLFHDLVPSPWMILTFDATARGREEIPGGIHVDGTARVQTVRRDDPTLFAPVIERLAARGEPAALLNTSFNRRGEPIVNTASEALTSAKAMNIDTVVLGNRLLDLP